MKGITSKCHKLCKADSDSSGMMTKERTTKTGHENAMCISKITLDFSAFSALSFRTTSPCTLIWSKIMSFSLVMSRFFHLTIKMSWPQCESSACCSINYLIKMTRLAKNSNVRNLVERIMETFAIVNKKNYQPLGNFGHAHQSS
jgi:hypothetical protein